MKPTGQTYILVQHVRINQNRHFVLRFTSLPVLTIFQPSFWSVLKVDDLECWITIQNLVILKTSQISILMKIEFILWLWQCSHFFHQDGCHYEISYANEPNHECSNPKFLFWGKFNFYCLNRFIPRHVIKKNQHFQICWGFTIILMVVPGKMHSIYILL